MEGMTLDPTVSLIPLSDYESDRLSAALAEAIDQLDGLSALAPGMTVGIKANLVSAMRPESAATTHPALLAALVRLLLARGAGRVIVGDSPGGLWTPAFVNRVYRVAGLDAVTEAGGVLNDDFSQKPGHFEDAVSAKTFTYTGWIDSCDLLINFCKLKAHGMMGMSAATKNLFGIIPGTMKPEYHFRFPEHEAFAHMIVDLAEFAKPVLSICDAVVGMEGNGPTQGVPKKIGLIAASKSSHALDLVLADLIGLSPDSVPTLAAAISRGLIPERADALLPRTHLDSFRVPDFANVASRRSLLFSGKGGPVGRLFSGVAKRALATRPKVASGCISCGKCRDICPAKAITMKDGKPQIRKSDCIRCFCCQEFCPVGAMKVHRTLIAKLLT
jgi:uncharacterized protein (DUF362 family)/NAD-dependent dihydropyrimidine dehydrogenase PreA subunit